MEALLIYGMVINILTRRYKIKLWFIILIH
jgi:hypothetical protein